MKLLISLLAGALFFVSAEAITSESKKPYIATAYCLKGRTASGRKVSRGIVAADPKIHKLGSRIYIHAGQYSGQYLVADTGGKIKGRRVDIWVPTVKEAIKFGKRQVFISY